MSERDIAIIGIGCRFPGGANSPKSFWNLMLSGGEGIVEIPSDRWEVSAVYDPRPGIPGKSIALRAGLIDGIDRFDAEFFGLSPREVEMMDPQQRLLLEASWEAIEDGGVVLESSGRDTAVFVGISTNDYALLQSGIDELRSIDVHSPTGGAASIAANRVSHVLDLGGPSIAVDTACSSALTAIHLACRALRAGDCKVALAGGVNAILLPMPFIAFSRMSMLSPDGQCKAFDSGANGFVRGEGVGIVALELLSDAVVKGRAIYAVIRGTAANQDGHTSSLTVPSAAAQQSLIQAACRDAGVTEVSIDYVEAHGTGTPIGDPIEADAIGRAIGQKRPADRPLLIGSVKTNIGHLEAGAGAAGMIKAALSLYHGQIPPSLHFRQPTPHADFSALNLKVVTEPTPFPAMPARVGVNSFGFGGSNAHAVVQSAPALPARNPVRDVGPLLLPLAVRSRKRISAVAQVWHDFLSADGEGAGADLADVCHAAATRRNHRGERLALIAADRSALMSQLSALATGQEDMANLVLGRPAERAPRPVFVYSGQGTQWWAMGRELLATEPVFAEMIGCCDALFAQLGGWSLIEELSRDEHSSRMDNTTIAQPAIFAIQAGLTCLLESWGIRPAATVGHSVGEVAAAWAAGVLSFECAARVIFHRGRCMEEAPERGRMMAAAIAPEAVGGLIAPFGGRVTLGAVNSSALVTLSGESTALETIAEGLQANGVFYRFLNVQYAFHSAHMDPVQVPLLEALAVVQVRPPQVPLISTVTGQPAEATDFDAPYWWRNVREPVLFGPAIERLARDGYDTFLEVGSHPALVGSINDCLRTVGLRGTVLSTLRRSKPERESLLRSLGMLYVQGHAVDWDAVFGGKRPALRLPREAWQRERFWHESEGARFFRTSHSLHPLLEGRVNTAEPTWQTHLDLRRLPWLEDHRVQGHAVFPAAGYLDMMLGAAAILSPGTGAVIEDAEFRQMLVVPGGDHPARVELRHHPADGRMEIWSCEQTGEWSLNARGTLLPAEEMKAPAGTDLVALRKSLDETFDTDLLAQFHADSGLEYGPAFRGLNAAWRRDGEAIGRIEAPESVRAWTERHAVHPCLLDACFQLITASLPRDAELTGGPFLPVQVDRFQLYQPLCGTLWCHVLLRTAEGRSIVCDLSVTDPKGTQLARIEGFRCHAISRQRSTASASSEGWLHRSIWRPQPRAGTARSAGSLAIQAEISAAAFRVAERDCAPEGRIGRRQHRLANADVVATDWIIAALRDLGWTFRKGSRYTVTQLADRLGIVLAHRQVFSRFLTFLAQDGVLARDGDRITVLARPTRRNPASEWSELLRSEPALLPELSLVYHCGLKLADVLRGRINSLDVLFSDAGAGALEHLYQSGLAVVSYNVMLAEAVSAAISSVPHGRPLSVLEIGAGTGGLTAHVLPRLPADTTRYVYTDLSPAFFRRAEKTFFDYRFVEFATLDIERDPATQGFAPGSFDIVLASDALHATRDLRQALTHASSLLAPGGLLGLIEITRPSRWADMVFGLTAGWWRFDDDLRTDHPAIDADVWQKGLSEAGLAEVQAVEFPLAEAGGQVVLLARRPTNVSAPVAVPSEPASSDSQTWLIVADGGGLGTALADRLSPRGERLVLALPDGTVRLPDGTTEKHELSDTAAMRRMLASLSAAGLNPQAALFLSALDAPTPDKLSAADLAEGQAGGTVALLTLVQLLTETTSAPARMVVATRGTQAVDDIVAPVNPTASLTWGLGRVIANEHRALNILLIDLDPRPSCPKDEARSVLEEIAYSDSEGEIALRGGSRYVNRVLRSSPEQIPRKRKPGDSPLMRRLEIPAPGMLDKLAFVERPRRSPGPGEVEIEVRAAAINFRDIMKALGIYPVADVLDELPGDECTGLVTAVGDGVTHVAPGDAVLAMGPGCFASHVILPAALVFPQPPTLDFEEAVTLPVPFLTAWHSLHEVGRMRRGETVLIHAATGGVGLAAIQVAREAGASVLATAGSPEKRAFLSAMGVADVMNSRSLSFADEVRRVTGGRGVDMILNSLAGRAIEKGLSVLAPGGRFLEIGKRDIYQNNSLGLRPFRNNVSFHAIDLHQVMTDWPRQAAREMQQVMRRVASGRFTALPHRVFPMDRAIDAFRHVSQARHIGKVVLSMRDVPLTGRGRGTSVPDRSPPRLRADASYLVTGGLSGFGLAFADWLVKCGARHLVLVSRQGPVRPEAQEVLARFHAEGVTVLAEAADVADPADLDNLFKRIAAEMLPVRGIFHAAMVLDDAIIASLTPERLARVTRPKVAGGWLLHQHSLAMDLDYFVLFSSVSALVGSSGQGNYVAANTFLVALAHYRRTLGLPALTVDWGRIADAGHVVSAPDVAARLDRLGLLGMPVAAATEALGRVLSADTAHVALIRIDWPTWSRSMSGTLQVRFSEIADAAETSDAGARGGLRDRLLSAPESERAALAVELLREQVGSVLRVSPGDLATDRPLSELGLDSLVAIDLVMRLESAFDISVATGRVNSKMTIEDLGTMVTGLLTGKTTATPRSATLPEAPAECLVTLRSDGSDAPLFLIHPGGGEVRIYSDLVAALPPGRPVIAVESRSLVGGHEEFELLADMTADYAAMIAARQPEGPLHLAGFSFGGHVAFAVAMALERQGRTVACIGILDSDLRLISRDVTTTDRLRMFVDEVSAWAASQGLYTLHSGAAVTSEDQVAELASLHETALVDRLLTLLNDVGQFSTRLPEALLHRMMALRIRHVRLLETHVPLPVAASLLVVSSRKTFAEAPYWQALTTSELRIKHVDCTHFDLLAPPSVIEVTEELASFLASAGSRCNQETRS